MCETSKQTNKKGKINKRKSREEKLIMFLSENLKFVFKIFWSSKDVFSPKFSELHCLLLSTLFDK